MAQDRVTVLGDRVRRPAGWWTPTVHALLDHLHDVGFTVAPKPLGIIDGQEFLSFLPGDSGAAGWRPAATDAGLRALARLLRDYHQATAGFVTPFRGDAQAMRWQGFDQPPDRVRRIEIFATEYGLTSIDGLVEAVVQRQLATGRHVLALAARGLEPQRSWVADGYCDQLAAQVAWSQENRTLLTAQGVDGARQT